MYGSEITVSYDASRIQSDVERLIQRKLKAGLSSDIQYEAAEIYRDLVNPYVPKKGGPKSGDLRGSTKIVRGASHALWGIEYDPISRGRKPYHYGAYQYYGDPSWNRTTPGTFDHWNRHLTSADRQGFKRAIANLVTEAMNDE